MGMRLRCLTQKGFLAVSVKWATYQLALDAAVGPASSLSVIHSML